jgi:sugar phosphate permease
LIFAVALAVSLVGIINVETLSMKLIMLAFIGFFTFGPQSLLVSQLPMIFGNSKNTGSIVGFIDGVGYIGAAITGILSGWLIDNFGWEYAFYFWLFGAVSSSIFIYLSNNIQKK